MRKTTLYLPDELKEALEQLSAQKRQSEAEIVRDAIAHAVRGLKRPRPRLPLQAHGLGDPMLAERADELLAAGFGQH